MSGTVQLLQDLEHATAGVPEALLRLILASALGAVVVALYRASRDPDARNASFTHTLALLAPLIAMVTMAVGQNVAAAFTLVGTLAIVRFRTVVRDTRDMAFVIFSVAVGMSMGALNLVAGLCGVVVIAGVVLVLRTIERSRPGLDAAVLRLTLSPPNPDPSIYAPTLGRYSTAHAIRKSAIDRAADTLELRLGVSGVAPSRSPALLTELLQIPEIVRATFSPEEPE